MDKSNLPPIDKSWKQNQDLSSPQITHISMQSTASNCTINYKGTEAASISKTPQKAQETPLKAVETGEIIPKTQGVPISQNNELNIYKGTEYKQFLKLLKSGKAINAVILGQALGVARQTIYKWLKTPAASKILATELNYHLKKIKQAKDWKSSAWMIERTIPKETDTTNVQLNYLPGLTIIRRDKS